jgi:hypothetical protein
VERQTLGVAAPPLIKTFSSNPANFLSGIQFGDLKLKDTRPPLSKAKFSKRTCLWLDT